jgi:hypothetical protein
MQGVPTNFVDLLIALAAMMVGKEVAHLVGPYLAIMVVAVGGAAISLGRSNEKTAFQAIWYVFLRVLLAASLTVGVVELLQELIPWAKPRFTLVPLAFAIGYIQDYGDAWRWLFDNVIGRFLPKGAGDGK